MVVVPTLNRKRTFGEQMLHNIPYIMLCIPAVILTIIFTYVPMYGILINFKSYNYIDGIMGSPWIGLENFRYIVASDQLYILVRNTVLYRVASIVTVNFFAGMFFALLLYEIRSRIASKIYQTSMLMTSFVSVSCVLYIIILLFDNTQAGIINSVLMSFGREEPINFFSVPAVWPPIIVFADFWQNAGQAALYFFAALLAIDPCLFEAANLDGAGRLKQIRYVSLPEMLPMGCLVLITQMGSIFSSGLGLNYFISQLTDGNVLKVINQFAMYTFEQMTSGREGSMGIAAATGLATSLIGLVMTHTVNAIVKKINANNALY